MKTEPAPTAALPERRDGRGSSVEDWSWYEIERATGAPTTCGNEIRLQFEGPSTFSAWLEAIDAAEKFVYFENSVYLLHDWLGCWATPRSYWKPLKKAGVRVRAFNPPAIRLGDPFGVVQRDHRKLVVIDGEVAYVGGLCVGEEWAGTPTAAPWRDTGVEIKGPAARAAALAFERLWSQIDEPVQLAGAAGPAAEEGGTPVWLIEGEPGRARVYRTLHLSASRARESIWITDAYFVAPRPLTEALAAAAQQGVDVRILVPAHNNWPIVGSMSRGGYRFLLESGVRIFEWQGPMMHAKTAVVDGAWCRVGSSNLNASSLMGNWELDVGVLDTGLGRQLAGLFMADLTSSVEIVLPTSAAVRRRQVSNEREVQTESLEPTGSLPERLEQQLRATGQSQGRLTLASIVRAREAFEGALAGNRRLGREDRTVLGLVSATLLVVAAVAALVPSAVGWIVVASAGWLGVTTGARAFLQRRRSRTAREATESGSSTRAEEDQA
jgi:cardiolipin synthase